MATAAFIDVAVDLELLKYKNRPQDRRLTFLCLLTAGCFVGAFSVMAVNPTFAIILCAVGKTMVTCAFLLNKAIEGGLQQT